MEPKYNRVEKNKIMMRVIAIKTILFFRLKGGEELSIKTQILLLELG
jgi:hypothetical protein